MRCKTYESFCKKTGLIKDPSELKKIKLPVRLKAKLVKSMDDNGLICAHSESARLLFKVVLANPDLHIITEVDSDDGNSSIMENCVRYVNRNSFFIGTKDKNEELYWVYKNCFKRGG
jgi:hypothetical protein